MKNSVILYVEDDAVTRQQLSKFLKSQCRVLYTAKDGQEGFELYQRFSPDIVITDIEMPKSDGLALAKKIRKDSLLTQIIIITAYTKPQYLLEAVNLQLVQYVTKPISLEKITQSLMLCTYFLESEKLTTKIQINEQLYYDSYTKELVDGGQIISLSKYERALIELLITKHPASASYESIDGHIYDYSASKNAIKLLVGSLRDKIKRKSVINVSGFGYKLNLMDDQ